jgi:hypothetical protein
VKHKPATPQAIARRFEFSPAPKVAKIAVGIDLGTVHEFCAAKLSALPIGPSTDDLIRAPIPDNETLFGDPGESVGKLFNCLQLKYGFHD